MEASSAISLCSPIGKQKCGNHIVQDKIILVTRCMTQYTFSSSKLHFVFQLLLVLFYPPIARTCTKLYNVIVCHIFSLALMHADFQYLCISVGHSKSVADALIIIALQCKLLKLYTRQVAVLMNPMNRKHFHVALNNIMFLKVLLANFVLFEYAKVLYISRYV